MTLRLPALIAIPFSANLIQVHSETGQRTQPRNGLPTILSDDRCFQLAAQRRTDLSIWPAKQPVLYEWEWALQWHEYILLQQRSHMVPLLQQFQFLL